MIIRATTKLLNISRIKPVKNQNDLSNIMPGEWYASIISLTYPGKFAVHFLHSPTLINIIIPGKSLNKTIPLLPDKIKSYLKRNGFSYLEAQFNLDSQTEMFTTNSRSMLGHMNQIKYNLEYLFAMAESTESINYEKIEDIYLDYLFGMPKGRGYLRTIEILNDLSKNTLP
jgi:hypothetical protein